MSFSQICVYKPCLPNSFLKGFISPFSGFGERSTQSYKLTFTFITFLTALLNPKLITTYMCLLFIWMFAYYATNIVLYTSTKLLKRMKPKPKPSVFPSSEIVLQTHIHSKNIFYECPLPNIFETIPNIYKSPKFNLHISLTGRHFAEFLRRP